MELAAGWEAASTPPGVIGDPAGLGELEWVPARVPGSAAAAVGADGRDFDAEDWWFRTRFDAPAADDGRVVLELDGIATVSEVYVNGTLVLESESMWAEHSVDVTAAISDGENELAIVCRALEPLLGHSRRPRQRWRTRIVADGNLRWYRTMIFGRSPGYAPGPAPVGPWREVRVGRRGAAGLQSLDLRPRLAGDDGVLDITARVRGAIAQAEAVLGGERCALEQTGEGVFQGELRIERVARWSPHTHGEPVLHDFSLELDGAPAAERRVGFRALSCAQDILEQGLDLHVNGVPVFARGALWTPSDLISMAPSANNLRKLLERVRDAGMNMLRVPGSGAYESRVFHDLCDELGILVWQDLMFASLDYPIADPEFRAVVEAEARAVVGRLAWRPSLAVVCGNHEIEQQPAMLGLDPALGRDPLWEETLPRIVLESGAGCAYVRSTPCGGELPFHPGRGIAHYFGIGGYFRSPKDARRAEVKFAAECLPFASVPDEVEYPVHDPRWKAGVQRDAGPAWQMAPGWDFDDERDFYFARHFGIDPTVLRRTDQQRYFELSRAVSGEVMAEVLGDWRRAASPCRGALILWYKDMLPGAGFGLLDDRGQPKAAYHHVRRALAPVAVWMTDEGTSGVALHAVNDRPGPLRVRLRVALYKDLQALVEQTEEIVTLAGHGSLQRNVDGMFGRFVDASCAYLFGPPSHDLIVASLEPEDGGAGALSQAFAFPAGRPLSREPAERLGIEAVAVSGAGEQPPVLRLRAARLLYGVRIEAPGFRAEDDAFSLEPGSERTVQLIAEDDSPEWRGASLTAINLEGRVTIALESS